MKTTNPTPLKPGTITLVVLLMATAVSGCTVIGSALDNLFCRDDPCPLGQERSLTYYCTCVDPDKQKDYKAPRNQEPVVLITVDPVDKNCDLASGYYAKNLDLSRVEVKIQEKRRHLYNDRLDAGLATYVSPRAE